MSLVLSSLFLCIIMLFLLSLIRSVLPEGQTNWNRVNVFWNLMFALVLSTFMVADFISTEESLQAENTNLGTFYKRSEERNSALVSQVQELRTKLATEKNKKYKIVIEKVP